jgi:peptidoglycan/LPS O-acetylase OafA/YrhL
MKQLSTIKEVLESNGKLKTTKISYLEGIRGIAAFMVVIHHFSLAFYPSLASGNLSTAHANSIELLYYKSPFIFLTNGQFYVNIFFILSGFVLSRRFFLEKKIEYLHSAFIRRVPRLYIPVAFSLLVAFVLIKLNWNFTHEAGSITRSIWLTSLGGDPSNIKFLCSFFFNAMFKGDNSYNTVLWTISIELYGSLLVFSILALTSDLFKPIYMYVLIFTVLALCGESEYCPFILGMSLNCTADFNWNNKYKKRVVLAGLIILGLLLGGFPHIHYKSTPTILGTFYDYFNYKPIVNQNNLINGLGAFFIVLAIQHSARMQTFFSRKTVAFFGYISFSMYLIHVLILQSFSCFMFLKLQDKLPYNIASLTTIGLSVVLVLYISKLTTTFVDKGSIQIANNIYKRFILFDRKK